MTTSSNTAQSDIRKSLESIQSLLSQNNQSKSPMTATTSLSSRLHRASLEGTGGKSSLSPSQPAAMTSSSSLAAAGGQFQLGREGSSGNSGGGGRGGNTSNSYGRESRSTSSVSFHPQSSNSNISSIGNGGGESTNYIVGVGASMQQNENTSSVSVNNAKSIIRRSPSSAFSTVNKLSFVGSPPLYGDASGGSGGDGITPSSILSSGGRATASTSTVAVGDGSHNFHSTHHIIQSGYNIPSNSRRETSLLVSPVSNQQQQQQQHLNIHVSPQSEVIVSGQHGVAHPHHAHHPGSTIPPAFTSPTLPASMAASNNDRSASLSVQTNILPSNQHHQQQQHHYGRDPTPYHYRSYPSTSPNHLHHQQHHLPHNHEDKVKLSDASSRSGRDPPATASGGGGGGGNNISMISTHSNNQHHHPTSSYTSSSLSSGPTSTTIGFATNKSTPNVHSHHYQQHENNNNELSMIEEDAASMVSCVTGSTFVRTPIVRKLHGNTTATSATTPRNVAGAGGSGTAANTSIHATPSTTQLLHRPSLAMRESLSHIASMTSHALTEIWDCVGVSPDERASQLSDLIERIGQLCEMKVHEEEALRDQFRKEIAEARKEWMEICTSLRLVNEEDPVAKLKRDPSTREVENEDGGVSLQWEYEAMTGRLETLRKVKQDAVEDMQGSQSRIFKGYAALNGISIQEASQASEMQPYLDMETNLTQERREEFRIKAQEYEESVWTRTRAVVSLVLDCQSMLRELEIVPPTEEASFGRSEDDFKIMNSLQPIDDDGQSAATQEQHRPGGGVQGMSGRGGSNNYTIVNLFESSTCIGIGNSALDRLSSRIAELNGEKRRRRAKLGEMGTIISTLWTMLRISSDEQKAFTMSIRGLGLDTIRKGEAEIARLEEIKGIMIGKLVREQRSIIEELWEKTNSSASERASFDAYYHIHDDEELTSEILVKHEDYAASLKDKLNKMQPILNLIAKREAILEERIELELLQKDPDRLKGRGATKQLMKEEKMSRRVTKELPKITSVLEETLRLWYAENKPSDGVSDPDIGHFMYNGTPYLRTMHWQEEEWRTRKERNDEERQRKRQEERDASSSSNAAFGTTYMKLPGKKWNPSVESHGTAGGSAAAAAAASSRPRSASTARSGSNIQSEGSHPPSRGNNNMQRSGSNMRIGGGGSRGPLGELSNTRQNTSSRPPSRPRGAGEGGIVQGKKPAGNQGFRPSSAPRMRL